VTGSAWRGCDRWGRTGSPGLPLMAGEVAYVGRRRSAWPMVMAGAVVLVVVAAIAIMGMGR